MESWYVKKTSGNQALILDEKTGKDIAVAYDAANAPLLAAGPDMLEILRETEKLLREAATHADKKVSMDQVRAWKQQANKIMVLLGEVNIPSLWEG